MVPHVFNADGMSFVSGLFWQPLSGSNQAERRREIVDLANELSFDLYVMRTAATHCVGFAKTGPALRPGVLSAAAVVSKTLELETGARDFIFVSQLPDGEWMYVAQRDGVILPEGDQTFATEDAAKSRLLEDMSLGVWPMIVAPAIWGIRGSEQRDFALMLPVRASGKRSLHKWWRLQPVDSRHALSIHSSKILLLIGVLLVAGGGWYYYQKEQTRIAAEKEAERLRLEMLATQKPVGTGGAPNMPPLPPPEHPWKSRPLAADLLAACMTAFHQAPLFPGNWDIASVRCAPGSLVISWKPRTGTGWIEHLRAVLPQASIAPDGSSASFSVRLPALTIGHNEVVESESVRKGAMYIGAQRYGIIFTNETLPVPPPPKPDQYGRVPPPQDWQEISWHVNGVTSPDVVLTALDGKGFRLNSMSALWENGQFTWNMEGIQYVQP